MILHLIKRCCQPTLLLLCSCLALSVGCANKVNYRDAQSLPPITVPEGLDKNTLGQLYGVPADVVAKYDTAQVQRRTPLPPSLNVRSVDTTASVQTQATQTWIAVPRPPAAVWSQLLGILQTLKQPLVKQDLDAATIATGWSTLGATASVAHRYQIQLQAGLQAQTTEIHLINKQASADAVFNNIALAGQTSEWPLMSENKPHERWFLTQLTRSLNASSSSGDSLLASRISLPAKVVLSSDAGEPVLEFSTSRVRTYAALYQSVERATNIRLYEQNIEQGVLYFDQVSSDEQKTVKKSFFQRLLPGNDASANVDSQRYELTQILQSLPTEAAVERLFPGQRQVNVLPNVEGYLLVVRPFNEKYRVYIRDGYGRALTVEEARRLLNTVQQAL